MIRTGIPFGYLFIALGLLAAFLFGAGVFVWGWRRRSLRARWLGAVLCASVFVLVVADTAFNSALEWNPVIRGDPEVVGSWSDRSQTITLESDHTFRYETNEEKLRGTWTRDDWSLFLHGDSYSGTMRFIRFRGKYRLMTHPPDDPDSWDGDVGLRFAQQH